MKKYIIANWKMLPTSWAEAEQLLDFVNDHLESTNEEEVFSSLIFCPPFVFLEEVGKILKTSHFEHQAELGAQDIAAPTSEVGEPTKASALNDNGALTGEVSGPMLQKLGVQYVIVGHSERRWSASWRIGESDEVVNKKLKAVLRNEMTPIVCLGEKIRDENFKEFLKEQTEKTFAGLSADEIGKCFIAYEPVWAISTNPNARPDTHQNALESISVIREHLNSKFKIRNLKFLYGGSVNSSNVIEFLEQKEIDGVLVGGASVNKEEFVKILKLI